MKISLTLAQETVLESLFVRRVRSDGTPHLSVGDNHSGFGPIPRRDVVNKLVKMGLVRCAEYESMLGGKAWRIDLTPAGREVVVAAVEPA